MILRNRYIDRPSPENQKVSFKMRLSYLLLLLICACDGFGSPAATPPLSEETLLNHLNFLAGDSLYGRGSATEYEREAAEYIRDEFIEYGLAPGVPGYFQEFTFDSGPSIAAIHATNPETASSIEIGSSGAGYLEGRTTSLNTNSSVQASQLFSQNVIGVLNGQGDLAGQWVVLGAHYDHIGFERVMEDSVVIYNGADDNASGAALLLEVARYMEHYLTEGVARQLGHRSILFQAYGSEEVGLVGSTYFVQHPTVSIDSITAMVNLDMVGRMRNDVLIALSSGTSLLWEPLLDERNETDLQLEFPRGVSGRSDHYPFYQANIPVIHLYTGTHGEYHDPEDDIWRLNTAGMLEIGDLIVGIMMDLAVRTEPPGFIR